MTAFRVTERSIATNVLVGLQGNLSREMTRHVRTQLGAGGPLVSVTTTNGGVAIHRR